MPVQQSHNTFQVSDLNLFFPKNSNGHRPTAVGFPTSPIFVIKECPCGWKGDVANDRVFCPRCGVMFMEYQRKLYEQERLQRVREQKKHEADEMKEEVRKLREAEREWVEASKGMKTENAKPKGRGA